MLPQDTMVSTDIEQGLRQREQDKGVCHLIREKKKEMHYLPLALTLTVALSPNHSATSNFEQQSTLFGLIIDNSAGYRITSVIVLADVLS